MKDFNENKDLISCIIAIYNVESYLEECIESLINQDYKNIEIILINDGSTDNSLEICKKYESLYENIILISQKNQGANVARNVGLANAKGEWVYFVDGDDYVNKNVFTALEEHLDDENDIIMFSYFKKIRDKMKRRKCPETTLFFSREDRDKLILATMDRLGESDINKYNIDTISIWIKLYRRAFLVKNRLEYIPHFPKLQDMSFNLMVYKHLEKAVFVDNPGYVYRLNENSVTIRYQEDFVKKYKIMKEWFDLYLNENYTKELYNAYQGRVLNLLRTTAVIYSCNKNNKSSSKQRKREFISLVDDANIDYDFVKGYIKRLPFKEKILSYFIVNKKWFLLEILVKLNEIYTSL